MNLDTLRARRGAILAISAKHGASGIRVFGSVARGQADSQSDVDLLVELEDGRSLFDLGAMQMELGQLLACQVDVATVRGIKARIRDRVLREAIPL